jgi:hypothetical protein
MFLSSGEGADIYSVGSIRKSSDRDPTDNWIRELGVRKRIV